ncbi:hypothetical protein Cgig2_028560 [Carnegiea gigantea]|uniref:DNA-directed RNA polymerase subunit n=1 Tax=Carnegiea gigantea TaxID=171969 RepID=A0A9Q1GLX4_9CARY|nr:hypothetical protein Cgig2_028560 [Carnegiea gigantea]
MFALSLLEHKLRVPASKLGLPLEDAIRGELESIFLDKVITKLGLCVSIYDIKSIDGGFILPNEGSPTYMVVFRVIMFRPYVGEVISAKLKESNTNGLRLSLEFFDDIYVPFYALPTPREAEPLDAEAGKEKPGDLEEHEKEKPSNPKESQKGKLMLVVNVLTVINHGFFIFPPRLLGGDPQIRFQVAGVRYPPIPLEQEEGSKPFAPMVVTVSFYLSTYHCGCGTYMFFQGSIDSDGLGPTVWWS